MKKAPGIFQFSYRKDIKLFTSAADFLIVSLTNIGSPEVRSFSFLEVGRCPCLVRSNSNCE